MNRKHSVIDGLEAELKSTVEQMLLAGSTYADVVEYLRQHDVPISMASVCRYAKAYNAAAATLNIAQENFRRMMDEMDKYPDLDTTEGIIRLASQYVFQALANTDADQLAKMDKDKLIDSALGLVHAAAYKKKADAAVKSTQEAGVDAVRTMMWEALGRDRPDLYREVSKYLKGVRKAPMEPVKKTKAK